jgi:transcriptional/translational regulatory protein YebC/TACO1
MGDLQYPTMAQPGGDWPLGSPRIEYSNGCYRDGVQPGRLETIHEDGNENDEDARTMMVSDLIQHLTVLSRDGNIDPNTHQRLMNALDAASNGPQPQP